MNWDDYRRAVDALPFDPDFQARTAALLRRQSNETSEKEHVTMRRKTIQKIAAIAAVIALLTVSAYAAVAWLSPAQVAEELGQSLLAEAFESGDALRINEGVETGGYRVTLAGLISGRGLSSWSNEVDQSRTYAVAALERLDGAPLEDERAGSNWVLTPLVSGYTPWSVNLWTLDSGVRTFDRDGVLYFLVDTQSLEMFADHTVYLAFYSGGAPSRETFTMGANGAIAFAEGYEGPHALFTLPLDAGKADPAAVEEFIAGSGFDRDWFTGSAAAEEPSVPTGAEQSPLSGDAGPDWMTAGDYEAYMEAEKSSMQDQMAKGVLSRANCDRAAAEMEKNLAGLLDGSLAAARLSDGTVAVMTSGEAAAAGGWSVSYGETEGGLLAVIR